jgi:hypothetical protein
MAGMKNGAQGDQKNNLVKFDMPELKDNVVQLQIPDLEPLSVEKIELPNLKPISVGKVEVPDFKPLTLEKLDVPDLKQVVEIPQYADGGVATGGKPYLVGEKGAELFVPSSTGRVVPNNQLGGGGVTVVQNINVTTGIQQTVRAEIANMLPAITEAAKAAVADSRMRGGGYSAGFGRHKMAAFPSVGFEKMTMRLKSATQISTSPFTFDQQVHEHQGVRWEAEVTLPPLARSEAKQVEGFFASLRGQSGTFTMGNPLHTTTATGTITSGAANATTVTGTLSNAVVW